MFLFCIDHMHLRVRSARSTATFHWPIARVRGPAPAACRHDMLTSVREIESDLSRLAKEPLNVHQTPLRWGT